jgi:hypothetical protein
LAEDKQVPNKKYPPDFTVTNITKGMVRTSPVDFMFHLLMAILLITGLVIDLLGPWLGGSLLTIRSIAHGYVGVLFILVFIVYIVHIASSQKMKMVLTQTNFVDFVFYIILIITGVIVAAANSPWIDIAPWLSEAFSPIGAHPQALHVTITYIWVLISLVTPSGLLHGFACTYLLTHLRRSKNKWGKR